jgi:hypothetical protein
MDGPTSVPKARVWINSVIFGSSKDIGVVDIPLPYTETFGNPETEENTQLGHSRRPLWEL